MPSLKDYSHWTHWDLNPGPSACEADVIPLHHVPLSSMHTDVTHCHLKGRMVQSTGLGFEPSYFRTGKGCAATMPSGFGFRGQRTTSAVCFISSVRAESISIFSLVCFP